MSGDKEINQRLRKMQKNIGFSVVINILIPLAVYMIIRKRFTNEAVPLLIIGASSIVRTIVIWKRRNRIDWLGLISSLGFIIVAVISVIS